LVDVLVGVDVFIGVFGLNLFVVLDIVWMGLDLIVFVLVNFDLEVDFIEVCLYAVVVVIGCLDFLN